LGYTGKSPKPFYWVFIIVNFWFGAIASPAHSAEDSALRILKLNQILHNIHLLRQGVHYRDEGRILVIEETVRKLAEAMEKEDAGSFEITRWQQLFFSKMRVSNPFFEFIRTSRTQNAIRELLSIYLEIRKNTKYDAGPLSKDVYAHFVQLQTVINRFRESDKIGAKLRERLGRVSRLLSEAIGVADANGDGHERTNHYVRLVYTTVKPLYTDLFSFLGTHPLNELGKEIVGTNDILSSLLEEGGGAP